MTFGINKCATLVVKPINFVKQINYEDPSFFIGSNNNGLGAIIDEWEKLEAIASNAFI